MTYNVTLSPVQRLAFDRVLGGIAAGDVLVLAGAAGAGKTAILEKAHATMGGDLVRLRQLIGRRDARDPLAIEEAFLGMLEEALSRYSLVFVDDLHLVTDIVESLDYASIFLLDAAMTAILGDAAGQGKKLVFATAGEPLWSVRRRAFFVPIGAPAGAAAAGLAG